MKWLLWKDYRHNRLIVFAGLFLLLLPYLIGLGVICGGRWIKTGTRDGQAVYWQPPWREVLGGSAAYSLIISQLTFALIGGNAISGERVDRSSEFLLSLPFARRRLLASKLLLALGIAATIWLFNAVCCACLAAGIPPPQHLDWHQMVLEFASEVALPFATLVITGLTFFCVAWFFSEFVTSPAFDVCGGVVAPGLVIIGIFLIDWILRASGWSTERFNAREVQSYYCATCLTLSLVCFGVGTWHYLRRVEP